MNWSKYLRVPQFRREYYIVVTLKSGATVELWAWTCKTQSNGETITSWTCHPSRTTRRPISILCNEIAAVEQRDWRWRLTQFCKE